MQYNTISDLFVHVSFCISVFALGLHISSLRNLHLNKEQQQQWKAECAVKPNRTNPSVANVAPPTEPEPNPWWLVYTSEPEREQVQQAAGQQRKRVNKR